MRARSLQSARQSLTDAGASVVTQRLARHWSQLAWLKIVSALPLRYDEAECEFQDCSLVAEQTLLGNAPAVQKEKRRQKQQEEDIRLQCNAEIGHGGDDRAECDLNEWYRQRHWGHARERAADDDRQK